MKCKAGDIDKAAIKSCPSRGTWIEIIRALCLPAPKESCPSRGTWIEIVALLAAFVAAAVVPLAGHVD